MMREGVNIDFFKFIVHPRGWWFRGEIDDSAWENRHGWSSRPDKHGPGFPEIVTAEPQGLRSWWTRGEP